MKIICIDSGVNVAHPTMKDRMKSCIQYDCKLEVNNSENFTITRVLPTDPIGHGTGIVYLITHFCPNIDIVMYSAITSTDGIDEILLIKVLEHIREYEDDYSMLLICAGLEVCENKRYLKQLCDAITQKGVWIVSAFSNSGGITFPAAFESVIGVDYSLACTKISDFQVVYNSEIDFRGIGHPLLLPSISDSFENQEGASFAAGQLAGILIKDEFEDEFCSKEQLKRRLERKAQKIFKNSNQSTQLPIFQIDKIALFPWSKEMESIIFLENYLKCKVSHVLDIRWSGNVRKEIPGICSSQQKHIIEDFSYYFPEEDETLVVGHFTMYGEKTKKNIKRKIFECSKQNISGIYLFDTYEFSEEEIEELRRNTRLYYPCLDDASVPRNRFGKLYQSSCPIIGIVGTSPKVGKFVLQVKLRNGLQKRGYTVKSLGTEPAGSLFGFEATVPNGLNSEVSINGINAVYGINRVLQNLDEDDPDLIIVGSQSQTVPTGFSNGLELNMGQYELYLGTQPDGVILCCSTTDDLDYVLRTLNFLEAINKTTVIGIVVSNFIYENRNGYLSRDKIFVEKQIVYSKMTEIQSNTHCTVFSSDQENLIESLINQIEAIYSGE